MGPGDENMTKNKRTAKVHAKGRKLWGTKRGMEYGQRVVLSINLFSAGEDSKLLHPNF